VLRTRENLHKKLILFVSFPFPGQQIYFRLNGWCFGGNKLAGLFVGELPLLNHNGWTAVTPASRPCLVEVANLLFSVFDPPQSLRTYDSNPAHGFRECHVLQLSYHSFQLVSLNYVTGRFMISLSSACTCDHRDFCAPRSVYVHSSWRPPQLDTLAVMAHEIGLRHLLSQRTAPYNDTSVRSLLPMFGKCDAKYGNRQRLRSTESGAQPGHESRGCRFDQLEEGECVGSRLSTFQVEEGTYISCRPRESAVLIVQLINSRNPNVSLLALAVSPVERFGRIVVFLT
jgi:hypothetical protein